jgi:hypothetical protein
MTASPDPVDYERGLRPDPNGSAESKSPRGADCQPQERRFMTPAGYACPCRLSTASQRRRRSCHGRDLGAPSLSSRRRSWWQARHSFRCPSTRRRSTEKQVIGNHSRHTAQRLSRSDRGCTRGITDLSNAALGAPTRGPPRRPQEAVATNGPRSRNFGLPACHSETVVIEMSGLVGSCEPPFATEES